MRLMIYTLFFNTWEVTTGIETDRNGCSRLDLGHLQVTTLELSLFLCLCFASSIMFFSLLLRISLSNLALFSFLFFSPLACIYDVLNAIWYNGLFHLFS